MKSLYNFTLPISQVKMKNYLHSHLASTLPTLFIGKFLNNIQLTKMQKFYEIPYESFRPTTHSFVH